MKETRFIAQNKEKWLESETLLHSPVKDPEKLSTLFTQVVDDLSYSRTYYPNRSVRVYLNKIARLYFSHIYSHKKENRNRFKLFWFDELPQIIIHCRKQLLISLLVFLVSMAIGVFSAYKDPQFTATILGDSYVSMTKANIERGDPMAVYKQSHQVDMFLGITLNNLMVAFRTYVFGVFIAIGSLGILLYNGIMVGCFQYFFIERGLFIESALTIWLHGTLEISSIIIAGGAGLTLGSGLIFPGTYSRLQAFQLSAIRSLKLMLGIAPIFVIAGIIESFLTRYTEIPDIFKLIIIIMSATLIIGYFIVFPWLKSRSGFEVPLEEVRLSPRINEKVSYTRLKNNAEIVKDTFLFYSRHFNKLLPWILAMGLCSATANFLLELDTFESIIAMDDWWVQVFAEIFYAVKTDSPWLILVNSLCTAILFYRVMSLMDGEAKKTRHQFRIMGLIQLVILIAVIFAAIYWSGWGVFLALISFAILLLIGFAQLTESSGLVYGISKGWDLMMANFKQLLEMKMILLLLALSFLLVLSAPLVYIYTEFLQWNFAPEDMWAKYAIHYLEIFIKTCSFFLVAPVMAASIGHLYFTLEEIYTAANLKETIEKIGMKNTRKR
jgi:uncharacterized membrane protein SpoIIM required for sporulation